MTLVVFAAGVLFGLWVGQEKVTELEQTTASLKSSIETAELQFALLDVLEPDVACNYLVSTANDLGKKSDELALEVERYESTQKINERDFQSLKKEYTATLIRNWVTLEKIKDACESSYTTILYFYSNNDCSKCKDQGIVLTYIKDKLEDDVMIFALDTDLNLMTVNALKESYGIGEYPSMVIRDSKYSGFISTEEITSVLCNGNKALSIC